jgi:hypothetical protein
MLEKPVVFQRAIGRVKPIVRERAVVETKPEEF